MEGAASRSSTCFLTSLVLRELGVKLVREMTPISRGRTIGLKVDRDTTGQFDGTRIGQLFSNLIGNAIQYSAPASEISLRIMGQAQNVLISVHNVGPIPQGKRSEEGRTFTPLLPRQ